MFLKVENALIFVSIERRKFFHRNVFGARRLPWDNDKLHRKVYLTKYRVGKRFLANDDRRDIDNRTCSSDQDLCRLLENRRDKFLRLNRRYNRRGRCNERDKVDRSLYCNDFSIRLAQSRGEQKNVKLLANVALINAMWNSSAPK